MKDKEKQQLKEMYEYYNYTCFVTQNHATQRAHIIANTNLNHSLFSDSVIDNPLNWLPCDNLTTNKLIDVGNNETAERVSLIIESDMDFDDKREEIEIIVKENIALKQGKVIKHEKLHD